MQQLGCTNNGNFLGCLEYLGEYDQIMSNHLQQYGSKGRGNPSYLSWNICDEVMELMASKVQSVIISEIKDSKYFAISVDSTSDLSHTDQLTLTVRYLSMSGVIRERFLEFIDIYGHSAENLHKVITTALGRLKIHIADCRGLATDNASNMSGIYTGLQQRLKETNHHINMVWSVKQCNYQDVATIRSQQNANACMLFCFQMIHVAMMPFRRQAQATSSERSHIL